MCCACSTCILTTRFTLGFFVICCVCSACILMTRVAIAFVSMGRGHVRAATVCEHNNHNGRDVISHASARARATNETRPFPDARARARARFFGTASDALAFGVCVCPKGFPMAF